ncbi:MAG: PQQ-binding-like beta-propeller repeat protein [Methanomassiliicoccaceae archaeon]|nr:PQQ-binding-like beta-propeller repeat protein [Methanomassiliicoccaceae archaeon]
MNKALPLIAIALVALTVVPIPSADAAQDGRILIDYGNGCYEWLSADVSGTYIDALKGCKEGVSYDGSSLRIDGMGRTSISSVTVDWRIYTWDGGGWRYSTSDPNSKCAGTSAFGLFPNESMTPSATPDDPAVWTQLGGSSGSYSVSPSYGPSGPALPVEWYNTYTTGYVDSGLVAAGDLLYHTTGGTFGGRGDDADPWIYCLDRNTGSVVWKYHGAYGSGYEVTTPIIVDGLLIVTTTNGDLYVFDRYSGGVLDKINIPFEPPADSGGDIIWDGRVFVTGGTTPVYDSGCIFFGSADGKVYCYSVSNSGKLSQAWCYDPPAAGSKGSYTGTKGCFYYHAPVIAGVDGKRMLFIGNYEGYVHALDITTGKAVWVKRVIDLGEDNRCVPDTPGSAAGMCISPDGSMLLVSCTDGGLFTLYGYLLALDPKTGNTMTRTDGAEWKLEGLFTSPVSTEGGFYTYATPVSSGKNTLTASDGSVIEISDAVYKFDWNGDVEWVSSSYQLIKAPLTLAGGVLYAMDYSAGSFWPTGGGLTAISADDGSELWRVLLSPYTADSYSMVQPTVIDGKVYAGNDFGAVYCLSATAGAGTEEERVEALHTQGFRHWSWAVVAAGAFLCILFLIRFY